MQVLIVEANPDLGGLWARHMRRLGARVSVAPGPREAVEALGRAAFDAVVIDLGLPEDSALAVADFAGFLHPETRVIFVTNSSFFSDGSIFALSPNASAFLQADMPPEDLAAIVEYHATAV